MDVCENANSLHHRLCMVHVVPSRRTAPLESPGFLHTRSRLLMQICVTYFAFPRMRATHFKCEHDSIPLAAIESGNLLGKGTEDMTALERKLAVESNHSSLIADWYFSIVEALGAQALFRRPALKRGIATTKSDRESERRRRIEGTCPCFIVNAAYSRFSMRFLKHDDNCNDNSDWQSERRR